MTCLGGGEAHIQAREIPNPRFFCSFWAELELSLERFILRHIRYGLHQIMPLFNWRSVLLGLEDLLELESHQGSPGCNIWEGKTEALSAQGLGHHCPALPRHLTSHLLSSGT